MTLGEPLREHFSYKGAKALEDRQYGMFDGRNPFVDLHLDFPVWFNDYVPGMTPFMVAVQKVKEANSAEGEDIFKLLQFHGQRVSQLNELHERVDEIPTILRLYRGKNKQLFKKRVEQFIGRELGSSLLPQDVNAALYLFLSRVFEPFVHMNPVREFVHDMTHLIFRLDQDHSKAFERFMSSLLDSKFLPNLQDDCLRLYPEVFKAELPLRPVLFVDLVGEYERNKIAARISTKDFVSYKDLYKDLAEVFGRQLVLVAGINNILKRGDPDIFAKSETGKPLSSLSKFADKTLSEKFKYIDDSWFKFDSSIVDTQARNAIAHYVAQYDEVTQIITYYPEKEGLQREQAQTMYFLDFMCMLLRLFREVHFLHHLIKGLFYFEFLVRAKRSERRSE